MHALVVQHAAPETPGLLGEALATQGVAMEVVQPFAGEPVPETVSGASALVVLGGPMGVYEADRYPHLRAEMRLIERALAVGVPVLGVCLGSQLLAHVLGATVEPGEAPEIGWLPVSLTPPGTEDPLFADARAGFVPLHWHGDVFGLPEGAVPLAYSAQTPLQAFRYDGAAAPAYGLLFHLEVTPRIVQGMLDGFGDEVRAADLDPEALRAETPDRLDALRPVAEPLWHAWARRVRDSR